METTDLMRFSWWDTPLRSPRELAEEYRSVLLSVQHETAACPYLGGFKKPWDYTCKSFWVVNTKHHGQHYTAQPWELDDVVPLLPFHTMMAVAIFDEPAYLDVMLKARPHWDPQQLAGTVLRGEVLDPVREAVAMLDLLGADLMADWCLLRRPQRAKYVVQVRGGRHSEWSTAVEWAQTLFETWVGVLK
jgi:hypothetical protein